MDKQGKNPGKQQNPLKTAQNQQKATKQKAQRDTNKHT